MSWMILDTNTVIPASSGTPSAMTATLSNMSGTNCMIIASVTVRSTLSTFTSMSCEWDGTPMNLAVFRDDALGGFGEGFSGIFWLEVGTLLNETADVVLIPSPNVANHGRAMTVYGLAGLLQVSPVHATDDLGFISGASGVTRVVVKDATDFAVCNLTLSSQLVPTGSAIMVIEGNVNNSAISGDPITHSSAYNIVADSTGTFAWTFNGSSAFTVVITSFFEAAAPSAPVISDVDGGAAVEPTNTNLTVNGTDLFTMGVTQLWVADSTVFATANKELQTISSITPTSLNWDFIDLGTVGQGDRFLFVVTDEGGGGELISSAFSIFIGTQDVHYTTRLYTTDGTIGNVNVVVDVDFDNPVAAIIRATGNTSLDTLQTDSVSCICFVSNSLTMGMCTGAQVAPTELYQRARSDGTGSLIIMAGGDGGEADLVVGTPVMTSVGLDINFTTNTSGLFLAITIFGGLSAQSALKVASTADGSVSGFGFTPDLVIGMTNGLDISAFSDSTFSLTSFGVAKSALAAEQWMMCNDHQNTNKNCALVPGDFVAQLVGTSFTWQISITSFDADGVSWTGVNNDYVHILGLKLPGMGIFVSEFIKESTGVDNLSEDLPDVGFHPGLFVLVTCARTDTGPAGAVGARWSQGSATPLGQGCKSIRQLPSTSPTVAEQKLSTQDIVDCSSVSGSSTVIGRITDFAQVSTIQWTTNPAAALRFCLIALEATDDPDNDPDTMVVDVGIV